MRVLRKQVKELQHNTRGSGICLTVLKMGYLGFG